jgi:cholesterol oxidase
VAGAGAGAFDAVVVGSGFGGAITALRLTEAGNRVLVLERGRRWQPADFPRDITDTDRVFWRYPRRRNAIGLYDVRFFSGLGAVVASGVGGGSLIYANIHIRPDSVVFEDARWPRSITRAALDPYYDRVAAMLGVAPIPAQPPVVKRDRFRAAAAATGHDVFDPDQAVDWGRCHYVAECEFGCRFGAKNSVDRTYLAAAERSGATLIPQLRVEGVAPAAAGGYKLSCSEVPSGRAVEYEAPIVVLAAGTLGTNEILLRSREHLRSLPRLSPRLGFGYSGNGDFLGSISGSREDLQPWHGSDVTSVMRFFDAAPGFTLAAPTFNRDTMLFLAGFGGQDGNRWLRPFAALLWRSLPWLVPLICRSGLLRRIRDHADPTSAAHLTNLFAIGRDNANGVVRLAGDTIDIAWDYARENAPLVARMERGMQAVASAYGGNFAPLFSWRLFRRILSVHSLGGCHLSDGPDQGVVTVNGEVHSYPGLYVADGSIVPSSIGFHPCMTIAALAEKIADNLTHHAM